MKGEVRVLLPRSLPALALWFWFLLRKPSTTMPVPSGLSAAPPFPFPSDLGTLTALLLSVLGVSASLDPAHTIVNSTLLNSL